MQAAEAPAPPPSGLAGVARRLDDGVLKVEQLLVTLAALVMTTTVTLDIIYRSFASDESVLARKLLTVFSWFGLVKTEENYVILRDYGTPALLALLAFFCGWAMFTSARKRAQRPRPVGLALAWGAFVLALAWGLIEFVLQVPSRWVCFTFLVGGAGAYAVYAVLHRDVFGVVLTALVALAGGWLCLKLPEGYIWSQELSLILLAWMAFLGGSMATRFEKHIQVDALSKLVPTGLRPWTRALGLAVTTAFCVYMSMLCYEQVFGPKGDFSSGEIRPATGLPAWVIVLAALASFVLMSVRFMARTIDAFVHPKQPEVGVPH